MEEEWKRSEREREALLAQIEAAQNASQPKLDLTINPFATDFDDVNSGAQTPQAMYSLTYLEDEPAVGSRSAQESDASPQMDSQGQQQLQQNPQAMLETQIAAPDPGQVSQFSSATLEDLYDSTVDPPYLLSLSFPSIFRRELCSPTSHLALTHPKTTPSQKIPPCTRIARLPISLILQPLHATILHLNLLSRISWKTTHDLPPQAPGSCKHFLSQEVLGSGVTLIPAREHKPPITLTLNLSAMRDTHYLTARFLPCVVRAVSHVSTEAFPLVPAVRHLIVEPLSHEAPLQIVAIMAASPIPILAPWVTRILTPLRIPICPHFPITVPIPWSILIPMPIP